MHWPDDENNARKPRYSAETGSRLLEKKNNDLENLKNEISKLNERLDTITLERDDVTNKLRTEITRSTDLEESLLARKEELVQEKLSRVNLEKELQSASDSCRLKDLEHRQLQRQLEDMSSRHNDVDQRNKISSLERKVQALQLENARLSGQVERPVSRNSSIPVPKGRQPRPSSDVRSSHLEDEIKTCRVELAEERSKVKRAEAKMRKAEADATQYLNEKIAAERKAQQQIEELENRLQEANDQLSSLPRLSQPDRENNVDVARYEKVLKDYRGVEEQLQAAKADNIDLTNRLNRKSAQCETLQEKLDECLYSAPDVESLSQELAIAKKEASDALKELAFLKESKRDNPNRRETLLAVRYELEDRDRELRTLQEKLRRRESSSAELEAQLEQISRLFSEREDLKDELAKANSRIRFLEPQSQFNQKEISLLRSQVTELEVELRKQRSLNSQQQELYHEIVKSCSEAERKAEELDQELSNLQEEFANRSSASEAVERRQQWEEALERVQELERELAGHKDKSRRAPRRSRPSLLPVPNFGDPSELDMVAKVVLALDRIREERNALRGSVEFLNFELQAKDAAIERRLENQKARFLNLLQSAEEDIVSLRQDLSACEDEISQLYQSRDEDDRIRRAQNISTATLVALQHINGVLDSEHERYTQEHAKLESELRDKDALEETVNKLTTLAQTKEDALSSLNVRYQEAIRDLQEATQSLRETQGKIRDLEETRDKLQDTLDDRTATLRNLERDHAAQTLHLERLEEAHQIAREELYEARVEADQLRNDHMNTLSEENPDAQSALMRHIEELDQRIMRRNEQIGIQQNEYRRLDMNLKIAEEAAENMRTELEELRVQRVWLEEDASNVRQERNLALRELEDVRVELDNVRTSLEKLETTNSTNEEARSKEAATLIELVFSSRAEIQAIKLSAKEEGSNACDPQLPLASSSVQDASVQVISDNESMQELEEAKRAIETLTNARIQESERLHNAEQRNTELQASLEEATSRGDALASQLRRATELAREELENRLVTLEEQVESLSVEVETLEERLAEGQEQLTMVLEQNGDLENQVTDLQSRAAASSKEAKQRAAEWEAEINELRTERDQLSQRDAEYVDLLQRHEVLEREHSAALLVVTESEKLKEQLDALQADKVEYNLTVDKLSSEVENYRVEREEFLSKLSDLDSLRANLRDRTQELEALQASRQQVEDELIALQDSMTQLQQIVDQRSSALRQCQEELNKALKEMDIVPQLRSTITQLEASTAKLQYELGEAQQAASAAASTTIRDAEADVRIIQLETSLATLKEENEELERVLTLKTKEIDDYDDRHIELLKERKKLVTKVDQLNRKLHQMQKQLDSAAVTPTVDTVQTMDTDAKTVRPHSAILRQHSKPRVSESEPEVVSRLVPTSSHLAPIASSGSKRSNLAPLITSSLPTETPAPSRTLSSSEPPMSTQVATPSSALGLVTSGPPIPQRTSLPDTVSTPLQPMKTPPAQSSSSRKRRMPDDFDPNPSEQMPAMPVLSTTPGRLRKALRDGPAPRTGFTPSRSRKNSTAAGVDNELATAAAAAIATLNIAPKTKRSVSSLSSKTSDAVLSTRPEPEATRSKPVADITNVGRTNRVASSSKPFAAELKTEPAAVSTKYRGGWLNRATKTTTTTSSSTSTTSATRRMYRGLDSGPELGSGAMPRRPLVDTRRPSKEVS